MAGPDHSASIEPSELAQLVKSIREVEQCLGSGIKMPQPSEVSNIHLVRKSLVAKTVIKKGTAFSKDNITCLRAGRGKSPLYYWQLLNQSATKDYLAGDLIDE